MSLAESSEFPGWPPRGWPVAMTASSLHLPGADPADTVPVLAAGGESTSPACPPAAAHLLLGRKGLLGKDAATRLALCAVHRALGLPPGHRPAAGPPDPAVAVVASSNLGNLATVAEMVRAVRVGRRKDISPMTAPGASSNVIASSVAIWFACGGPCLMVCSGAASGADAIMTGALLLRAGRAAKVIVVGAEPGDDVAVALQRRRVPPAAKLREGAACVVLERAGGAVGAPLIAPVPSRRAMTGPAGTVVVGPASEALPGAVCIDLAAAWGDLYGAHGIAQAVVAAALARGRQAARVVCGDHADGWQWLDVYPPERAARFPIAGEELSRRFAAVPPASDGDLCWH